MQKKRPGFVGGLLLVAHAAVPGCSGSSDPTSETLIDSFVSQIESVEAVQQFRRGDDELTFVGPDGAGGQSNWLVRIESANVEPYDDPALPYRGVVTSVWYRDGEKVEFFGTMSFLPEEFLETGIAQECWALWEAGLEEWGW